MTVKVYRAGPRLVSVRVVCNEFFENRDFGFGSNVAPKWDKSRTFSNHISVHFRLPNRNVLNYEQKKSRICPILVSLTHFGPKSGHPSYESCKWNNKAISMMLWEITTFLETIKSNNSLGFKEDF